MPPRDSMKSIEETILRSPAGMEVSLLNLGATIRSIRVPTDAGVINAVLGYANLEDYLRDDYYHGTTAGRFANRIAGARFALGDKIISVDANEGRNCLHGGSDGISRHLWQQRSVAAEASIEYVYVSPAGESGFPGELEVTVNYQLVNDYSLVIDFEAITDAETVVNIVNHAYFNLDAQQELIDTHDIQIDADHYTPVDDELIPSGEICEVEATRFDLRRPTALRATNSQDNPSRQYDHNFVLHDSGGSLRKVATLSSPQSGLAMHLHTTQVALQFYTGEGLAEPFHPRAGLCLEAQGFPDAPNQPSFPSARLAPGDVYKQRTIYEFVPGEPYS